MGEVVEIGSGNGRRRVALKPHEKKIRGWVDEGRTDAFVALQLGTSPNSVELFRRKNGIIGRTRETGSLEANISRIKDQVSQGRTDTEIAKILGSTSSAVANFRSRRGIYRPTKEHPHIEDGREGEPEDHPHGRRPMKRKAPRASNPPVVAYDLETSRIEEGTPDLLYITAYGRDIELSQRVGSSLGLFGILKEHFLTKGRHRTRYVGWNTNRFDVYFVGRALLSPGAHELFEIRPYLTSSKSLRGLRVEGKGELEGFYWEFLDARAMTGQNCKFSKFVESFAPDLPKLERDFDTGVAFDPDDPKDVAYAMRDSEALYAAFKQASNIVKKHFGIPLQPTIGNTAIKIFQCHLPEDVLVWRPTEDCLKALESATRGGYVWATEQYEGPLYKYDQNQAYAAAMREARLPCGSQVHTIRYVPGKWGIYRCTFSREKKTRVPFYYKVPGKNSGYFSDGVEDEAWITSGELEFLLETGWSVTVHEGYYWTRHFNMKELVDRLERERRGDPKGPKGTMMKAIGNNAFGKTLEKLGKEELFISSGEPAGCFLYRDEDPNFKNVYCRLAEEAPLRDYHRPQIGCAITSYVRVKQMRAALAMEEDFLYADTDCVAFKQPASHLDIDKTRYGAWKEEAAGEIFYILGKKTYASEDGSEMKAKGIVARLPGFKDTLKVIKTLPGALDAHEPLGHALTEENYVERIGSHPGIRKELERRGCLFPASYRDWLVGKVPRQEQNQLQNFLSFTGEESPMYVRRERSGTDFGSLETTTLTEDGGFMPQTHHEIENRREEEAKKRYEKRIVQEGDKAERSILREAILTIGGMATHKDGTLQEELSSIPNTLKRKNGLPPDVVAEYLSLSRPELGVEDEVGLLEKIKDLYG